MSLENSQLPIRKAPSLRSQSGQMIVETVLLIMVSLSITGLIIKGLKQQQFIQSLVSKPWGLLSGMIQCGAWEACGGQGASAGVHPATRNRNVSLNPKESQ